MRICRFFSNLVNYRYLSLQHSPFKLGAKTNRIACFYFRNRFSRTGLSNNSIIGRYLCTETSSCTAELNPQKVLEEDMKRVEKEIERYLECKCAFLPRKDKRLPKTNYSAYFREDSAAFHELVRRLLCFKLLKDGTGDAYARFIYGQNKNQRPSQSIFNTWHKKLWSVLNSHYKELNPEQIEELMQMMIILMSYFGESSQGYQNLICNKVRDNHSFPTYQEALKMLEKILNLCWSFPHLNPVTQHYLVFIAPYLPNYLDIFSLVGGTNVYPTGPYPNSTEFLLGFFPLLFSIPAKGEEGELPLIGCSHNDFLLFGKLLALCEKPQDPLSLYQNYFEYVASFVDLKPAVEEDSILIVVAAILGLFTRKDGLILKNSFNEFSDKEKTEILKVLAVHQPFFTVPLDVREFLQELVNYSSVDTREKKTEVAVRKGLPFIAKVCWQAQKQKLNFNEVSRIKLCCVLEQIQDQDLSLLEKPFTINDKNILFSKDE